MLEQELHDTMHAVADAMDVSDDGVSLATIASRLHAAASPLRRWTLVVHLAAVVTFLVGAVAVIARTHEHERVAITAPSSNASDGRALPLLSQSQWSQHFSGRTGPRYVLRRGDAPAGAPDSVVMVDGSDILIDIEGSLVVSTEQLGASRFDVALVSLLGGGRSSNVGVAPLDAVRVNIDGVDVPAWSVPGGRFTVFIAAPRPSKSILAMGSDGKVVASSGAREESLPQHTLGAAADCCGRGVFRVVDHTISRLDSRTGRITQTRDLGFNAGPIAIGDRIWVGDANAAVVELDWTTLAPVRRVPLAEAPTTMAFGNTRLWVGGKTLLVAVNEFDGAVTTLPVASAVVSISGSPDHTRVYDLLNDGQEVEMRDGATLAVVARKRLNGPGGGTLAATDKGVWVAYPTGMLASADLLSRDRLSVIAHADMKGAGGSNAMTLAVSDRLLWLFDPALAGLVCSDPSTGTVRSIVRPGNDSVGVSLIAADHDNAYLTGPSGTEIVRPPTTCYAPTK